MPRLNVAVIGLAALFAAVPVAAEPPAKALFGAVATPSVDPPAAIGGYARGCLAGGVRLPADGPGWQAMRLDRERQFGHPALVAFVERLAGTLVAAGHPGLLVGDLAQPRGGPMTGDHRSHQSGLDVDLWYRPAPAEPYGRAARETVPALPVVRPGTRELDGERFAAFETARMLRAAARDPAVARLFVHPTIKRALCRRTEGERAWLRKVRPWWGHDHHVHVRLACPAGTGACVPQDPPPPGDGCDETLAWWFTDEPWAPSDAEPPAPLALGDLPARCARLVGAD
jgi:penicillin-insensitive murein endopeptidase